MDNLYLNGKKSIEETIQDPQLNKLIKIVYLTSTQKFLIEQCQTFNIPYEIKTKNWFKNHNNECKYKNALAILKDKKSITLSELLKSTQQKPNSLIVILDKLHDPYNFGAILRTCVAAGVDGVICANHHTTKINSTILKTSQGVALQINLVFVPNLNFALEKLKQAGFWSYASVLEEKSKIYSDIKYEPKSVLILGNEGEGISDLLQKNSDFHIKIPINKTVNSLNVSVATGILLFEYVKQISNI